MDQVASELKELAMEVVSKFSVLTAYYSQNLELNAQCAVIIQKMITDIKNNHT